MIYSEDMGGLALNFIHGRIKRGIGGFIKGGFNPVSGITGFVSPGGGGGGARPPTQLEMSRAQSAAAPGGGGCARLGTATTAFRLCNDISAGKLPATSFAPRPPPSSAATSGGCPGFSSVRIAGRCVNLGDLGPGGSPAVTQLVGGGGMANEVVMGRYGAAYVPASRIIDRAVCLPGDVVGNDGFCYPRKSITNRERMWPKGRQPLLTGGEMRAISIAARAGRRVEGATKRLQKIGLMKKPRPRSS